MIQNERHGRTSKRYLKIVEESITKNTKTLLKISSYMHISEDYVIILKNITNIF